MEKKNNKKMDRMKKLVSEHPWSNLSTITTFDIGDDQNKESTLTTDKATNEIIRSINIIGLLKAKASTPISLLVESLVQQLCSLLEPDSIKATKLYNIICDKLFEMKLIDESYSMEEFEVMRSQYQRALYHLVGLARASDPPKTLSYPVLQTLDSRYDREFIELSYLGGGGFGQVYKAKHRLDGTEYAVKKICISAATVKAVMTHLDEVKTFAILNHPNVVQYKAAWLEPSTKPIPQEDDFEDSYSSDSDFQIEFTSKSSSKQICPIQNYVKSEWVTLYIQMALCQLTLKQWLEERNAQKGIDPDERFQMIQNIFKQLVTGLEYIHSKGIVHHDIKPNNIFISEENGKILVQLGDFGLACPLEKSHNEIGIGTQLYAAPEQLQGKCNSKSDIFSLGLILLELMESFGTDMERVKNLMELRKGKIPAQILAEYPQLAHIMSKLVYKRVENRPTATELLSLLETDPSGLVSINNDLKRQIRDKDAEIERLKNLIQEMSLK